MRTGATTVTDLSLQERMVSLVREFGLHRPGETPCGQPVPAAEAQLSDHEKHASPGDGRHSPRH